MSLTSLDLGLYALALFVLFLTPGPVWLALIARAMAGGFRAAWPLAFGMIGGGDIGLDAMGMNIGAIPNVPQSSRTE